MLDTPSSSLSAPPLPRLRWWARARLFGAAGAAIAVILWAWSRPPQTANALTLIIAALIGLNVALLLYLSRLAPEQLSERTGRRLTHGQMALDLCAITLLLFFGGSQSPFFAFYLLPVALSAALLSRRSALGGAALACGLYLLVLLSEAARLAGRGALPARDGLSLLAHGVTLAAICLAAAGFTAALAGALRAWADRLAETQHRAEVRSAHMHELNEQLRAANEECRRQRQRLNATYNELLQAYQRLQTRSNHMSELNEQLRQANAECKARREELEQVNAELAQANARLRELDDFRARFTLLVTHELRAPVAAIQGYLRLILDGYVPEPKIPETLAKAERRAMEQLALIADLLELGRVGSTEARAQIGPVQVDALLREQADLFAPAAHERGITLEMAIQPDLPPVQANPEQIKSLWGNLLSNALKYNRDGGRIEVALEHVDDRLLACVADTGIGIPPEALPRLFAEFFRADNAKASDRTGTGLGLSIVKEIVTHTGGQISVESQLGAGTTFRFWLPAPGAQAPAAPSSPVFSPGGA